MSAALCAQASAQMPKCLKRMASASSFHNPLWASQQSASFLNSGSISPESAAQKGIELVYVNTTALEDAYDGLMTISEGHGYDDVFVYAPIRQVAELGDRLLAFDGCMNFFAGPTNKDFMADINLYNVHYTSSHIMGTTGGDNNDLIEANALAARGVIDPSVMVTHIGGIDSIAEATLGLPKIPGGKKLTYTQFNMPLTAIEDFAKLGETDRSRFSAISISPATCCHRRTASARSTVSAV